MARYRKRPVAVEAFQFRAGEQDGSVAADVVAGNVRYTEDGLMLIRTLEGVMRAHPGDWIIRGVKGELYPCKPDIFAATYRVDEGEDRDYRKERDDAYTERNRVVAALARVLIEHASPHAINHVAWLAEHDPTDASWDPEWRTIVFIDGPTGQLSWHLHDSDVPLFDGLPRGLNTWDQHTTAEKYERVARLGR